MAQTHDQRRASRGVSAWLAHHERNIAWLIRKTKADAGTIGDFLNGNRWPKFQNQGRIEKAIGWPAGTLTAIADGAEVPGLEDHEEPAEAETAPLALVTDEDLVSEVLRRIRQEPVAAPSSATSSPVDATVRTVAEQVRNEKELQRRRDTQGGQGGEILEGEAEAGSG